MNRKLRLGRETLRNLDRKDLRSVAGGETGTGPTPYVASVKQRCIQTEQTACIPSYYCTPDV